MSLPHEAEITFQFVPPTGTLKNNKMIIILACRSCPGMFIHFSWVIWGLIFLKTESKQEDPNDPQILGN